MNPLDTCSLCPRLCRNACPVATVTEAGTPSTLARVLLDHALGRVTAHVAVAAATSCTDCGGCHDACALGRPLPTLLAAARDRLGVAPVPAPLAPVDGDASPVVVEPDERPLAAAVARRLGRPVAAWPTRDWLGADVLGHAGAAAHVARVRAAVGKRPLWVIDGGSARVGRAAGIEVHWLDEALGGTSPGAGSCARDGHRPFGCCGAAGPLRTHHPEEAAAIARAWRGRSPGTVRDARCAAFFRSLGGTDDPVAAWLA